MALVVHWVICSNGIVDIIMITQMFVRLKKTGICVPQLYTYYVDTRGKHRALSLFICPSQSKEPEYFKLFFNNTSNLKKRYYNLHQRYVNCDRKLCLIVQ